MRLLIDMNLTVRWVRQLLDAGHEAVHRSKIGKPTAPDGEISSSTVKRGFVIPTNDLDVVPPPV